MMLTRSRARARLLATEDDDKLAQKGSASSQSDYLKIDTVTLSNAPMMAPKIEIPERLYIYVNLALEAEQKLKTWPDDEDLLQQLSYDKEQIRIVAEFYKDTGHLPSDWEYHPDTASSYVPMKCSIVPAEKNIPRDPRMDSAILGGEPAKAARLNLKKLDKKIKKADKVAEKRSTSSQSDYQKIDRVTSSKDSRIIYTRSLMAREADDKLVKKGSASSQSDYQKIDSVTQSNAPMMEQKLEIPKSLYECINLILEAEEKLKTCPNDEGWLEQSSYAKGRIGSLTDFYKQFGWLSSDWEYNPDIASSYVPKSYVSQSCVPKKKPKKNIPRNPHIDGAPLVGEPAKVKAGRRNYKKLDEKSKAYTLAKNHSASSQSDNQKIDRITPSKVSPELEIPDSVNMYVKLTLEAEQKLKTRPDDECLLRKVSYYKEQIDSYANIFKARGQLLSDWKYDPDLASSYVSIKFPLPKKVIKRDIHPNPHINSVQLKGKQAKAVWQTFKKLDKTFKKPTRLGLPFPTDENLFTRLATNHKFVTFICDFAVRVFNESCEMYRDNNNNDNNKNIINPEVQECKYIKVEPCYIFYMTIEAVEQGKSGTYEINLRCNLDDGAIALESFCLKGSEPLGTRKGDFVSLESIYKTVKDDSLTDPEVCYYKSGMVRRTGGYDFYNPTGWDRLWVWDDVWDNESDEESDDECD